MESRSNHFSVGIARRPVATEASLWSAAALVLSCIVLGAMTLYAMNAQTGAAFVYYSLMAILVAAISMLGYHFCSMRSLRTLDLFEIPAWYSVATMITLVSFGFAVFQDENLRTPNLADFSWLGDGLWLPAVGLAGLWMGHWLGSRLKSKGNPTVERFASPQMVAFLYAAIWLNRIWRLETIGWGYGFNLSMVGNQPALAQWSAYLDRSAYILVAAVAINVFSGRWAKRYLWPVLALELLYGGSTGMSKPLLWLWLIVMGAAIYTGHQVFSRRSVLIGGLMLVLLAISTPITLRFRALVTSGAVNFRDPLSLSEGIMDAATTSLSAGSDEALSVTEERFLGRQSTVVQTLGIIVHYTPEVYPYWGADRLLKIPLYVLPRAIWPDKPILSTGYEFNIRYLGGVASNMTSSADTMYGNLYLHAGWMALFLGMFIFGVGSGWFYRRYVVHALTIGDYSALALYLAIALSVLDIENTYIENLVGMLQELVIFIPIWMLAHPKAKIAGNQSRVSIARSWGRPVQP